jgi:hypothetical protein
MFGTTPDTRGVEIRIDTAKRTRFPKRHGKVHTIRIVDRESASRRCRPSTSPEEPMTRYRTLVRSLQFSPPRSRAGVAVLAGDLAVVLALITIGLLSHNVPEPWQFPAYVFSRFAPFAIAWLLVSPLVGLFREARLGSYRGTVTVLIPAWICAAVLGAVFRAVGTSGGASPVFVAVIAGFGLLMLLPWRLASVAAYRRLHR